MASWVARTAGERTGEFSELLAYHYSTAVASVRETGGELDPELRSTALRWLLRASHDARRRMVVKKAERTAEEALALAVDDLERVDALEALAEAFFAQYKGDLAWRYFRDAALLRADLDPPDGARVAYLAARACEVPQRWPGSMREAPPPEEEVEALYRLGLEAAPAGDNAERVRLLGLRAGWAFGYPNDAWTDKQLEDFERIGIEAAEMALRIGEPNLASAAYDQANAVWVSRGWYGRGYPLWERRRDIIPTVTDIMEIGDFYAMGAWMLYELGRYAEAVQVSNEGLPVITGRGPNVELHLRSWRIAALHRLGAWDEAFDEFGQILDLLDQRRDDPPYFVTHAFAMTAIMDEARGDRVGSDRLAGLLTRLADEGHSRLYAGLLRFLVVRGDLEIARDLPRASTWRIHAGDVYEALSELLGSSGAWDDVPALLETMREHAAAADAPSLAGFADRLEGRGALAGGDPVTAARLLGQAVARFGELGAVWECALTELDLSAALWAAGRDEEAVLTAERAAETLKRLGCVRDLARARALAGTANPS